ncbi:hypothetical protein [Helicobacter sp. 23-1045]
MTKIRADSANFDYFFALDSAFYTRFAESTPSPNLPRFGMWGFVKHLK